VPSAGIPKTLTPFGGRRRLTPDGQGKGSNLDNFAWEGRPKKKKRKLAHYVEESAGLDAPMGRQGHVERGVRHASACSCGVLKGTSGLRHLATK